MSKNVFGEGVEKEREEEEWRKTTIRPLLVDQEQYLIKDTDGPPLQCHTRTNMSPGVSGTVALIFVYTKLVCFYFDDDFWEVW